MRLAVDRPPTVIPRKDGMGANLVPDSLRGTTLPGRSGPTTGQPHARLGLAGLALPTIKPRWHGRADSLSALEPMSGGRQAR